MGSDTPESARAGLSGLQDIHHPPTPEFRPELECSLTQINLFVFFLFVLTLSGFARGEGEGEVLMTCATIITPHVNCVLAIVTLKKMGELLHLLYVKN